MELAFFPKIFLKKRPANIYNPLVERREEKMENKMDIAVIGAGPGGYVAAIRAAQLKKSVVLVEKENVGGTCVNWGCIPAKFLLRQTQLFQELKQNKFLEGPSAELRYNWKNVQAEKDKRVARMVQGIDFLLKRNGVKVIQGEAQLRPDKRIEVKSGEQNLVFEADKVILATGSRPAELPFLKPNSREIITSKEALGLEEIPGELLIVGAGAIGLEMGAIFQRLGSQVTILEILPQILPGSDPEITKKLERLLKGQGLNILTSMQIEEARVEDAQVYLQGICLKDQAAFEYRAEKALLAVGRYPVSECLRKLSSEISFKESGFVEVNSHLETGLSGVYAVGDLIGGKLLAHKASHEGILAVENACGANKAMNYQALPLAIFTEPEFSYVGMTELEAEEKFGKVKVGLYSLQANGRALTLGSQEGMVKIVADKDEHILGAHILAPHASEIIPEMVMAIAKKMKLMDVAANVHIHPTLSEAVMEAALKARNESIHMLNI